MTLVFIFLGLVVFFFIVGLGVILSGGAFIIALAIIAGLFLLAKPLFIGIFTAIGYIFLIPFAILYILLQLLWNWTAVPLFSLPKFSDDWMEKYRETDATKLIEK